jgi:hypothetical protein
VKVNGARSLLRHPRPHNTMDGVTNADFGLSLDIIAGNSVCGAVTCCFVSLWVGFGLLSR